MHRRVRVAGATGLAIALAMAVVTAAGCSSSKNDNASDKKPTGMDAYVECMRKNGVNMDMRGMGSRGPGDPSGRPRAGRSGEPGGWPSGERPSGMRPSGMWPSGARPSGMPQGGFGGRMPSGVDASAWAKAQEACRSLRPTGGPGGAGQPGGQRNDGADEAYRNCLSEHGVKDSEGVDDLNTSDPATAAAVQACAPLRPSTPNAS